MKTRQFIQLASVARDRRDELLIEGLNLISRDIRRLRDEFDRCTDGGAHRAAQLIRNAAVEEAGKFLLLIDHYRDPNRPQADQAKQFKRAGDHLAKLLYAQMADYAIGDREELISAIDHHRAALYLDGPNDVDWIFANDLVATRESALYTDLVDLEGSLEWSEPRQADWARSPGQELDLVLAIADTGLISTAGFRALEAAWTDFDHTSRTYYTEWGERSAAAVERLSGSLGDRQLEHDWERAARSVIRLWPMPMTRTDLSLIRRTVADLQTERDTRWRATLADEYGYPVL